MAINLQNYRESKARSGYGACLMFIDPLATDDVKDKYRLFIPLETVPSIEGSVDSFEFDLLNSTVKGKVGGKESLDDKDVEFLWHRDNVKRLEQYEDMVLNFMVVYADFTAKKFIGTIKVRPNDVSNDVARGTFTITPMSAETKTVYDCRSEVVATTAFVTAVPDYVTLDLAKDKTSGKVYTLEVEPTTATLSATSDKTDVATVQVSGKKLTITPVAAGTALITVKATATGFATWEQTIAVEVVATT